ncbi:hypothetical protein ACJIZ3_025036 [Penstemon smallii]|uniref:Transmembrane protein n=1 Tax=Penstemon smallii TaxID=265156 RepID=A0ABD3TW33_9LAMI
MKNHYYFMFVAIVLLAIGSQLHPVHCRALRPAPETSAVGAEQGPSLVSMVPAFSVSSNNFSSSSTHHIADKS